MTEQKTLFHTVNGNVVVKNFAAPDPPESKTIPTTVKLTDSLKKQIQEFCFEHDMSVSEFLRDAACFYHDFYPQSVRLAKYREAVLAMLHKLP